VWRGAVVSFRHFFLAKLYADLDEPGKLKLGTRVEALKSGTQGTWYVARIVEFASFPARYLDGIDSDESPNEWYLMVCVHYEGQYSIFRYS
jgi:hypothetical protein